MCKGTHVQTGPLAELTTCSSREWTKSNTLLPVIVAVDRFHSEPITRYVDLVAQLAKMPLELLSIFSHDHDSGRRNAGLTICLCATMPTDPDAMAFPGSQSRTSQLQDRAVVFAHSSSFPLSTSRLSVTSTNPPWQEANSATDTPSG